MRENQIARLPGKHRQVVDATDGCAEAGADEDPEPDRKVQECHGELMQLAGADPRDRCRARLRDYKTASANFSPHLTNVAGSGLKGLLPPRA